MSAPLSRHLAAFPVLLIALVLLVVGQSARSASAASNDPALYQFGYNPHPDFVAFDPHYPTMHDRLSKDLEAAHAEMIRQQRAGRKTFCTRQIYLEAHWLVYYTADYARARQRIDDLRRMLAQKKDPYDREQVDSDGSFAPCCNAWWLSSSFYFGVSFLHEIGYFTQANRFWTDRAFPDAQATRKRILDRIQALKLDDSEATWTLWLLRLDRE